MTACIPARSVGLVAGLVLGFTALAQDEPLDTGRSTVEMVFDGQARSYLAYVPESYTSDEAVALVVALHPTGGSPEGIVRLARLETWAQRKGFIAVAPGALGHAFNDGSGRGGTRSRGVDDVGFIEAVISEVRTRANIDAGRIFLTGFASGASMAQRVALESDYEIAAIFAPAGHLWAADEAPARGRPLLLMWGTRDRLNPRDGGAILHPRSKVTLDKPPPLASAAEWARRMGCGHKLESSWASGEVRRTLWQECSDGAVVELYMIEGLGHHWPGGRPVRLPESRIGPYSDAVNATEIMWEFFMRHAR